MSSRSLSIPELIEVARFESYQFLLVARPPPPLHRVRFVAATTMTAKRRRRNVVEIIRNCRGRVDDETFGMMQAWHAVGDSIRVIAKRLNIARRTVTYNIAQQLAPSKRKAHRAPAVTIGKRAEIRHRREMVKSLALQRITTVKELQKPRSVEQRTIVTIPFPSPASIARHLNSTNSGNQTVSASTVRRDLLASGIKAYRRRKKPWTNPATKTERKAFAGRVLRRGKAECTTILFSDEKWFDCDDHGNIWEWRPEDMPPTCRGTSQYPKKIHVWGCIGIGFKMLVFFDRNGELPPGTVKYGPGRPKKGEKREPKVTVKATVNAKVYAKKCLSPMVSALKRRRMLDRVVFMQDGATVHTSKETRAWLEKAKLKVLPSWPSHSPDLNPIENLWGQLAVAVSRHAPFGEDEVRKFLKQEWDAVPQAQIDDLVRSFHGRMTECRDLDGGHLIR